MAAPPPLPPPPSPQSLPPLLGHCLRPRPAARVPLGATQLGLARRFMI